MLLPGVVWENIHRKGFSLFVGSLVLEQCMWGLLMYTNTTVECPRERFLLISVRFRC